MTRAGEWVKSKRAVGDVLAMGELRRVKSWYKEAGEVYLVLEGLEQCGAFVERWFDTGPAADTLVDVDPVTQQAPPGYPEAAVKEVPELAVVPGRALRFNTGKPELFYADLFPAAIAGVAKTYEYGTKRKANPYPRYNWRKGAPYLELYDCARRHMVKWLNREENDPDAAANDFEISHLDFAISNLMRLRQQIADGKNELDDRP